MSSLRVRLFEDATISPVQTSTSGSMWDELETVLTPYGKIISMDSEIGSANLSIKIPSRKCRRATVSRRSLFSGKRPADDDLDEESPATKKVRDAFQNVALTESPLASSNIIEAVERLECRDLVADGSHAYTLPIISGKHSDLKSISSETMADVVDGRYNEHFGRVTIVDCRYPYEFEGGHIRDAVNLYTKDDVNALLQPAPTSDKPHVLIFHCEFSSERGPKMYRFLRSQDRELNKHCYPRLNFPEVYLLHGGYKAFFTTYKDSCNPLSYKPMLHEAHATDLRHFRVKSKSWTAGEKQQTSRRQRSRLSRLIDF